MEKRKTNTNKPDTSDLFDDKKEKKSPISFLQIEEIIRQKILIPDLIHLEHNRAECIILGNPTSHNPSFEYYPSTNTWRCHKCKKGGNAIALHSHINNITYEESWKALCDQLKITISPLSKKESELYLKTKECLKKFIELCHENLLNSDHLNYLKQKRNFTNETIKEFKLGLYNNKIKEKMNNLFPKIILYEAGLTSNDRYWYSKQNSIVYPYLNINKNPVYCIFRRVETDTDYDPERRFKKLKTRKFITNEIFGLNSISKFRNADEIIITEGIADAISVVQAGHPVLSPVTTQFSEKDYVKIPNHLKKFNSTIVINDTETNESGLKGAIKSIKYLFQKGIDVNLGKIPNPNNLEKIDLDDYLGRGETIEKQKKLLKTLITDSIPAYDYFINKIQKDFINMKSIQKKNKFLETQLIFMLEIIPNEIYINDIKAVFEKKFNLPRSIINKEIKKNLILKSEKEEDEEPNWLIFSKEILKMFNIITVSDSRQMLIKKGIHYAIGEANKDGENAEVIKSINKLIENDPKESYSGLKHNIIEFIKDKTLFDREKFQFNTKEIVFSNGVFNIENNTFYPIEEIKDKRFFFYEIPHNYKNDKKYNCTNFKMLLYQWLGSFQENTTRPRDIFEQIGYCMTTLIFIKKAFINLGKPDTGKSTFMNIIEELLGNNNICGVSVQRVTEQFGTNALQFKILNYYPDLSKRAIKDTGIFKNITGGDKFIPGEIKGGSQYRFRNTVKCVFNTNSLTKIYDINDNAFFGRWILNHFIKEFTTEKKNKILELDNRITNDPNEMQGIIHESIKGVKRLIERGEFRNKIQKNTKHIWLYDCFEIYAFIYDNCIPAPYGYIETERMQHFYNLHLGLLGKTSVSKQRLKKDLIRFSIQKEQKNLGFDDDNKQITKQCYLGLNWKDPNNIQDIIIKNIKKRKLPKKLGFI